LLLNQLNHSGKESGSVPSRHPVGPFQVDAKGATLCETVITSPYPWPNPIYQYSLRQGIEDGFLAP
jgi:hypothetical protein